MMGKNSHIHLSNYFAKQEMIPQTTAIMIVSMNPLQCPLLKLNLHLDSGK